MVVYPVVFRRLLSAALVFGGLLLVPDPAFAQSAPQPAPRPAGPVSYGCEEGNFAGSYYQLDGRMVFDESRHAAYTLRLNTPVFQNSSGDARVTRALKFGERVVISDPGNGTDRLKIKDSTNQQQIGWAARQSLYCNEKPIRDSGNDGAAGTGLYKRVVVRTETAVARQVVAKQLYQTPIAGEPRCDGRCATASRFQWFFIYAEENDHYLISSAADLRSNRATFEGWLPKGDGYSWNTALGLRPREDLQTLAATTPRTGNLEGFICAYETEQELLANSNCAQIIGGRRWFGLEVRMAVLKETPQHYEVLFSNASTAGQRISTQSLNQLDVFFVIDGTRSMSGAIEAIKQLSQTINQKLRDKLGSGGVVRYGFRVYRDSTKNGRDGVENSESLELPKANCGVTNERDFNDKFRSVRAVDPPGDDDFPENSFGAIAQATEDAGGCPQNNKMIVVIGDHGYDVAKQQSRGHTVWTEAALVQRLQSRIGKNVTLLFVQIPREANANAEYTKAYADFERQGRSLLSSYYQGTSIGQANSWGSHFITLPAGTATSSAAVDKTWRQVDSLVLPADAQRLEDELRRGVGLKEAIERVQNNSKENIPVLWKERATELLCQQLGPQCDSTVFERVTRAFVKNDGSVVPEVLLSRDQVDHWLRILNVFKTSPPLGMGARNALVSNWQAGISDVMQVPLGTSALPIGAVAQLAGGLPNSARSKLMQYPDGMLRNTTQVPDCEIEYLKQYASKRYDMLNIVHQSDGRVRPIFGQAQAPAGACPNLSQLGRNIPFIDGAVTPELLNRPSEQTSYSMMHPRSGVQFFWIPVNYLP
jgi:hypothetical protein